MRACGFTLRECLSLAELATVRWPGPAPDAPATPPLFTRIGLESSIHPGAAAQTDLTGELALNPSLPDAARWWRATSAPGVARLLRQLSTTGEPRRVLALYAEFDATLRGPLRTSVFATLDWTRTPEQQTRDCLAIAARLLDRESNTRVAPLLVERLAGLGPHVRAYHLGFMLGREGAAGRLVAIGPTKELAGWAARSGHRGADVEAIVNELGGPSCQPTLHLGIHAHSVDELSVELAPRLDLPDHERHQVWIELFQRLVRRGHVDVGHADALLRWPGLHRVRGPRAFDLTCARALSHVKLVCDQRGPVRVKAYGTLTPRLTLRLDEHRA